MARNKRFLEGWDTVGVLGVGGFGKVYEIRKSDAPDKFKSALKVISIPKNENEIKEYEDDGYDENSIQKLLTAKKDKVISEFDLMANFKGTSNIVSYEDHYVKNHPNGLGWDILIRMELLTTLPDYLAEKGYISESDVIDIGRDMCKALKLCSEKNIIHRDIKPQNIFRNDFGDYKLGDFGIAKEYDHATKATKTGTYSYMAPEVYRGDQYGKNVDIYSLGMVLYWLLNEKRGPFLPLPPLVPSNHDQEQATIRRFSGEALPDPKHGSRQLKDIVLKACSYSPFERYRSAEDMFDDLNRIVGSKDPLYRIVQKQKKVIPVEQETTEDAETVTLIDQPYGRMDENRMSFEVFFDPDNGRPVERTRVNAMQLVLKPADPIKEGYKFVGWYDYGTRYNFNKPVDRSLHLKALYKKKSPLKLIVLAVLLVLIGSMFYIAANGEEIGFLRRFFYRDSYIVYFDGNGGTSQLESIRVEKGKAITNMPTASAKDMYFEGWYDNPVAGNKYNSDTAITENIKLYAHYKIDPSGIYAGSSDSASSAMSVISFDPNGGSCEVKEISVATDQIVLQLPTPYWQGHRFVGWSDKKSGEREIYKPGEFSIVGKVVFYAVWETAE